MEKQAKEAIIVEKETTPITTTSQQVKVSETVTKVNNIARAMEQDFDSEASWKSKYEAIREQNNVLIDMFRHPKRQTTVVESPESDGVAVYSNSEISDESDAVSESGTETAHNESWYSMNSMVDDNETEAVRFENAEYQKLGQNDCRLLANDMSVSIVGLRQAHANNFATQDTVSEPVLDAVQRVAASFEKFKALHGDID